MAAELVGASEARSIAAAPRAGRYHGFDGLRIVAALAVVVTHAFSTTGHTDDKPLVTIGDRLLGAGSLGVSVFFVISGFLVTQSWQRSHGAGRFLLRRAVRIWPALLLMVALATFVVGPIVTDLGLGAYLTDAGTWRFAWRNSTLVTGVTFELPGVFADNPGQPVSASLWTLPYEVWCYVGLTALGLVGALRRRSVVLGLFVLALVLHLVATPGDDPWIRASGWGLSARKGAELASLFLGGALLAIWPVERRWLLGGGGALIALALVADHWAPFAIGLPAVVVGLGHLDGPLSRAAGRWGDPSYGVYILHYPVQQCLVAAGLVTTSWAMVAVSAPLALGLGYASWHLVEHRALERLRRPRPVAGATAPDRP